MYESSSAPSSPQVTYVDTTSRNNMIVRSSSPRWPSKNDPPADPTLLYPPRDVNIESDASQRHDWPTDASTAAPSGALDASIRKYQWFIQPSFCKNKPKRRETNKSNETKRKPVISISSSIPASWSERQCACMRMRAIMTNYSKVTTMVPDVQQCVSLSHLSKKRAGKVTWESLFHVRSHRVNGYLKTEVKQNYIIHAPSIEQPIVLHHFLRGLLLNEFKKKCSSSPYTVPYLLFMIDLIVPPPDGQSLRSLPIILRKNSSLPSVKEDISLLYTINEHAQLSSN